MEYGLDGGSGNRCHNRDPSGADCVDAFHLLHKSIIKFVFLKLNHFQVRNTIKTISLGYNL